MELRVTVLVDNIGNEEKELKGEWGPSFYIEYGAKKILLDAGASRLFQNNAKALQIPLEDVDFAVLSHAHVDHANGLPAFLEQNRTAPLYLQEQAADNCYYKKWFFRSYVGIPRGMMQDYADRISYVSGDCEICKGVYLVAHHTKGLELLGKKANMYIKSGKKLVPDDFAHEQSLVFDTQEGLVILNSCSHGGAVNIINEVAAAFPSKKVYALIGGFHLASRPAAEVEEIAEKIRETGIDYVYTGHCTGRKSFQVMKQVLGEHLEQLHVGLTIEL